MTSEEPPRSEIEAFLEPPTEPAAPVEAWEPAEEGEPTTTRLRDNAVVDWARAIALGLRDTGRDMLDHGRRGARAKRNEMWRKYDAKTKHRRAPKD